MLKHFSNFTDYKMQSKKIKATFQLKPSWTHVATYTARLKT